MSMRLIIISTVVTLCVVVIVAGGTEDPRKDNQVGGVSRPAKHPRCTLKGNGRKCQCDSDCCSNNCQWKRCVKAIAAESSNAECIEAGQPCGTDDQATCCVGTTCKRNGPMSSEQTCQ